jgi:chromosome segregation ATPase
MDIFGRKTIAELQSRISAYEEELAKQKDSIERLKAKLQQETLQKEGLLEQKRQVEEALARSEAENEKIRQRLSDAEKMVKWLEEKVSLAGKENLEVKRVNEALSAKVSELEAEIEKLRATIKDEALRKKEHEHLSEKIKQLEQENLTLRKALIQKEEKLKVALRKAEHNRRAYLVTLMQLDLAEDKIYMLLHGKPRPVLRRPQAGIKEGEVVPPEAEEVEPDDENNKEEQTDQ